MWMYFEGKRSMASASTSSKNVYVFSLPTQYSHTGAPLGAAIQLGIGEQGWHAVARHVELRHDRDVPRSGVSHHLLDFVLRVMARLDPLAARGRIEQFGILLDFDAPRAQVGQVPVQDVELVRGHGVDEVVDEGQRLEIVARVEHQPPPAEAGIVPDLHAGDGPSHVGDLFAGVNLRRQELQKRLHAVEEPGLGRCAEPRFSRV